MSPGRTGGALDAEERAKLDARIVKLLKHHRRLTHHQLLHLLQRETADSPPDGKIAQHRSHQLCPLEAVKACIDGLISKEYIIRDESDRHVARANALAAAGIASCGAATFRRRLVWLLCSAGMSTVMSPEGLYCGMRRLRLS